MTPWILAVLGLWVAQTFVAAGFRTVLAPNPQEATWDHMKGKDRPPEPSLLGGRAARAQQNMAEALPVFLGLALLLEVQGTTSSLAWQGAAVFLIARVLYVPAYMAGILGVRSTVWGIGLVGLGMMVAAVLSGPGAAL
jgi:uncharacterized MAPEG superfamily protein